VVVPTHVPSEDIKERYKVEFFIQHQDYLRTIDDPSENKKTSLDAIKEK
jgi:hypothetical protein